MSSDFPFTYAYEQTIAANRWCRMSQKIAIQDQNRASADKFAYRIDEACHALGIGRSSIYQLFKAGELKAIKVAGRTLVPRSELERLTSVDRAA